MTTLLESPRLPRHPLLVGRFALVALRSAVGLARARFRDVRGRAAGSAAYGVVLAFLGHACGWPSHEVEPDV